MRRLLLVAALLLGAAACDHTATCEDACDNLRECYGAGLESCVSDCEAALEHEHTTQECITCRADSSCSELDPTDGSRPACGSECDGGGGMSLVCVTDEDCDSAAGEVCDVAEEMCQLPCASDADCEDQLCCPDGDVADCKDEC